MWQSRALETDAEQGFTLIEVLTALAIAAVAMVTLYRAVTQSTTASLALQNHLAADTLARSILLDAAQQPLQGAIDRNGATGQFKWRVKSELLRGNVALLAPKGLSLVTLTVTVTWPPGGRVDLDTMVLGK